MDYSKISPTARLVAYARAILGQPYAQKIIEIIGNCSDFVDSTLPDESIRVRFLIHLEGRYRGVLHAIHQAGNNCIFELAGGLSPMGLICSEDEAITYLETDLADMVEEKNTILRQIGEDRRINYVTRTLNAMDGDLMVSCPRQHFGRNPVTIVAEGLVPYLDMHERHILLQNIHAVLDAQDGGCAILAGIVTREGLSSDETRRRIAGPAFTAIKDVTGRHMLDLAFDSSNAAIDFFGQSGFATERVDHTQFLSEMTRPSAEVLSDEQILQILARMNTFVLRLA